MLGTGARTEDALLDTLLDAQHRMRRELQEHPQVVRRGEQVRRRCERVVEHQLRKAVGTEGGHLVGNLGREWKGRRNVGVSGCGLVECHMRLLQLARRLLSRLARCAPLSLQLLVLLLQVCGASVGLHRLRRQDFQIVADGVSELLYRLVLH